MHPLLSGGPPEVPLVDPLAIIFTPVTPKQRRPANPLPQRRTLLGDAIFDIERCDYGRRGVSRDMQLAHARDQSLLVVDDHFQLRRGVITKERVIAARGRTVHRGNRETLRRDVRPSVKYRPGKWILKPHM